MALSAAHSLIVLLVFLGVVVHYRRRREEAKAHSISPEVLLKLMKEKANVLLFDVRLPLDLLAHSEIIPGAIRLPPKEVAAQAGSISKDIDIVIYGTCLDNKTLYISC